MDEKILIKSEHYSLKKFMKTVLICSVLLSLIWFAISYAVYYSDLKNRSDYYWQQAENQYEYRLNEKDCIHFGYKTSDGVKFTTEEFYEIHPTFESYAKCLKKHVPWNYHTVGFADGFDVIHWLALIPLALNLFSLFIWFYMKNYSLTVTDKRVYGNTNFGKQVDLPIDSVSAVAMSWANGITIGTSSSKISFALIKNRDEIQETLSDLIIARQTKSSAKEEKTTNSSDYTEELKKIKELLDAGVITTEEFEAKKKQILGL